MFVGRVARHRAQAGVAGALRRLPVAGGVAAPTETMKPPALPESEFHRLLPTLGEAGRQRGQELERLQQQRY